MALNAEVRNNLIAKTLLSHELDFNDTSDVGGTAQGKINREALLNRVKKLNKLERSELMQGLKELTDRINPLEPLPPNAPPLSERGLATLLLADDGKKAEGHHFIVSFFLGLMNLFNQRISSAAVLNKLTETRELLLSKGYEQTVNMDDAEPELTAKILTMENLLKQPDPSEQIKPLIKRLESIKNLLDQSKPLDWADPTTLLNFNISLAEFKNEIENVKAIITPELKAKFDEEIAKIDDFIDDRRSAFNFTSLESALLERSGYFQEVGISKEELEKCLEVSKRTPDEREKYKYVEKELLVPFIEKKLLTMKAELQNCISNFDKDKSALQSELAVVKNRLELYKLRIKNSGQRKELQIKRSDLRKIEKDLKNINVVNGLIDVLLAAKEKPLNAISLRVNQIRRGFSSSSDSELKETGNFEQYLYLLFRFVNNDPDLLNQDLANGLDQLELLNGSDAQDLYNKLNQFKTDPSSTSFDTEPNKINFIKDYVDYLKFIFGNLKTRKEKEQRLLKEAIERLVKPVKVESPPVPKESPEKKPVVVPQPVEIVSNPIQPLPSVPESPLPEKLTIPSTIDGKLQYLRAIAEGLQNHQEEKGQVPSSWFKQIESKIEAESMMIQVNGKDKKLALQVYENFYWIMKQANLVGGSDDNWGKKVMINEQLNLLSKQISPALLNHYRVQAMVEVLEGKYRTEVKQTL